MRNRCLNPRGGDYMRYGGRGITICPQWLNFEGFLADMGHPPTERHTLDRVDNDGDYRPENCRWSTRAEQSRNRSSNVLTQDVADEIRRLVHAGVRQARIAEKYGADTATIAHVVAGRTWSR